MSPYSVAAVDRIPEPFVLWRGLGVLVLGTAICILPAACENLHTTSIRAVNTAGTILDAAEPALAASERAALKVAVASSTSREEAEAHVASITLKYHGVWLAYEAARNSEILAMGAVRAEEQGVAASPGEVAARVTEMQRAEAAFMAAVAALKGK